jgi:uncharacterized protein (TIGR01777 family)
MMDGSSLKRPSTVLITGGTGLIGRHLTDLLMGKGYSVRHLSRNPGSFNGVKSFAWNPVKGTIDKNALEGVASIIHLAGANIGEGRWTVNRKNEIFRSRVDSTELLYSAVSEMEHKPATFVSASAIGYYGSATMPDIYKEDSAPAGDFLGKVCLEWEKRAKLFESAGIRTVILRTGVVMEKSDSALSKLLIPARLGIFPVVGSGDQFIPWIHISDIISLYFKALTDSSMKGVYNAVSPEHLTQKGLMKALAAAMGKPFISLPVPGLAIRLAMGESSTVVLKGSRVSAEKIISAGYVFRFPGISEAIADAIT